MSDITTNYGWPLPERGEEFLDLLMRQILLLQDADLLGVANPPAARVYHNANQSVANTTVVPLAFNTERFDTDSIHSTSVNNSRLTCRTAGLYLITYSLEFATNAVGLRSAVPRLNGDNTKFLDASEIPAISGGTTKLTGATIYELAVNDYVELIVFQASGGSLNVLSTGNYSPEFGMVKVG
jgi:hypothetical protein